MYLLDVQYHKLTIFITASSNDFTMHSASQDMHCEMLGLESGNEFAIAFSGRLSLLQSWSRNVSMCVLLDFHFEKVG